MTIAKGIHHLAKSIVSNPPVRRGSRNLILYLVSGKEDVSVETGAELFHLYEWLTPQARQRQQASTLKYCTPPFRWWSRDTPRPANSTSHSKDVGAIRYADAIIPPNV
jgi:hypothetical protein